MNLSKKLNDTFDRLRALYRTLKSDETVSTEICTDLKAIADDVSTLSKDIFTLEYLQAQSQVYPQLFDLISDDVSTTYQNLVEWLCNHLGAEQSYVVQPDDTGKWVVTHRCPDAENPQNNTLHSTFLHIMSTHDDIIHTTTAEQLKSDPPALTDFRLREVFMMPLTADNQHLGGLYFDRRVSTHSWTNNDRLFLEQLRPAIIQAILLSKRLAEK